VRNEAFAQAFLERLAGSQGRALSRTPQSPELLLETRCPARVSTQTYKKGKTVPLDGLSHERTLCAKSISLAAASDYFFILVDFRKSENQKGVSRSAERDSGQRCPRVRALAERVGHSLAGKRPTGAFSGSARFEKGWRKLYFA